MIKQQRRCEVAFAYNPMNEDELPLAVGETIAILREIEDGWWLGMKDGKVGAFPSNFAKEIFVGPKETKSSEGKTRPKLTDAVFTKENKLPQKASVRRKKKAGIRRTRAGGKERSTGHQGFFPDNFVMLIPQQDKQGKSQTSGVHSRMGCGVLPLC
ncbi:hypothetical protein CRUP_033869 [Coryphaenoides rupestris]|nr:hypothetical protein CRUP_033869 [Coryphaenoides rupestris]